MDEEAPPRVPTWVKALGGVLLLAVAALAVLHLMGNAPVGH